MTEIAETPVTGFPGKRTPREELEKPLTRKKKEPGFILDASGSNLEYADPEGTILKVDLVCRTLEILVPVLEKDDAEAAHEAGGGGVRTFAGNEPGEIEFEEGEDESDDPRDLRDMNSVNLPDRLRQFRDLVNMRGRTFLLPAVRALKRAFGIEFPGDTTRCLEIVIMTDGRLHDAKEFEEWIEKNAGPDCVIVVVVYGYGDDHDRAVEHYQKIARSNKYVTVDALTGVADPMEIAYDLKFMADLGN